MNGNKECLDVQRMLGDYSAENLGRADSQKVRNHLAECPECFKEMTDLQAAMELVEDFGALEPPTGLWNGVYNRLTSTEQAGRTAHSWPVRWLNHPLGLLASGLAVILVILGLMMTQPHSPRTEPVDSIAQEYVGGHAMLAQEQLFADRINLNLIAAAAEDEQTTNDKL